MKKGSYLFVVTILFSCFSQLLGQVSEYQLPELKGDYVFGVDKAVALNGSKLNMTDGMINVAPGDEPAWRISGIKDGKYYIQLLRGESSSSFIPFGLFINGKGVTFTEYTPPVPYKDISFVIMQAGPVELRNGDEVRGRYSNQTFLGGFSLSKKKAKAPMPLWTDRAVPEDYFRVTGSFHGTEKVPGTASFNFMLLNVEGKKDTLNVKCVILDYFQKELNSSVQKNVEIENRGVFENELLFSTGASDRYRAVVTVTDSAGHQDKFTEEILVDRLEGTRKKVWTNDGWEWFSLRDDGTYDSRVLGTPAGFKGDEKWQKTDLPFDWKGSGQENHHIAWFRKKIAFPANFAGKRYFMHFERAAFEAKVFLNGKEVGTHLNPVSSFDMEVTGMFLPGQENEIIIGMRDEMAVTEESELKREKMGDNRWLESGFRTGLGEIYFCSTGEYPIRNIFAKPSFRKKELAAEVLMPETLPEDDMILSVKVFLAGCELFNFDRKKIKASDAGKKIVFREKWYNPPLWGPDEFPLLELTTELRDSRGATLDQARTRFGFREFYAEGKNLMWNGVKVKFGSRAFMNPWSSNLNVTNKRKNMREMVKIAFRNECRMLRHIYGAADFAEIADEEGMPFAQGMITMSGPTEKKLNSDIFWDKACEYDIEMIKGMWNHPCIVTWYLSNEFMGQSYEKNGNRLKTLGEKIQDVDDTRIIEFGCDLDLHGASEIISTHYPVEKDALRKADVYFPEAAYWRNFKQSFEPGMKVPAGMCKCVANVAGESPVTWGYRPIIVNETCWIGFFNSPDGFTKFFSDNVYTGSDSLARAHDLANIWFVRGHRDAEVSAITLWKHITVNPNSIVIPRIDINILQKYNKFFSGERVVYDVNLNRDIFDSANLVYRWNLENGDGRSLGSLEKVLHFGPSDMKREKIRLHLPEVGKITKLTLEVSLMDGKSLELLRVEELPITVYPADTSVSQGSFSWFSLAEEENKIRTDLNTAVLDPQDNLVPLLEGMMENSQKLEKIKELTEKNLSGVDLLVISEDSEIDKMEGAGTVIMNFVEKGGNVLLLKQKILQNWLPGKMLLTERVSAINYSFRQDHPLLEGISEGELSYWYPDHKVVEKSYVKPKSGNYKVIVESGGPRGLVYAGLIEFIEGKGRIICSQLRMTDDLDINPVPFRLWKNIFRYCATRQIELKPAGYIGPKTSAGKKALEANKVAIKDVGTAELKDFSVAILDADAGLGDGDVPALKNFVSAGGILFIQGTTPENVGKVSKVCGSELKVFKPGPLQWTGRAVKLGGVPETAGLTNYDFFWKMKSETEDSFACYYSEKTAITDLGAWVIKSDVGESLLFPSYIVKTNFGKGRIILDNLNWANPKPENSDCCSRILSTLMTNVGVKISQ